MLLAVCVAVVAFVVVSAVDGGGSGGGHPRGEAATPFAAYFARAPHVLSSAAVYPLSRTPQLPSYPELVSSRFRAPIAQYRAYAASQLGVMERRLAPLRAALEANDRSAARAAWRSAYTTYLKLGAVYLVGPVAALNQQIDGTAGGLPGGVSNRRFTGLHRIEYGLWSGAPPRSLVATEQQLQVAVRRLHAAVPHVTILPLEYATRAHEILEDAQRDLLSGADVPWSGEGPLATYAGLEATEEVISTLKPLLVSDEEVLRSVRDELSVLRSRMDAIALAHGGRLPPNPSLTRAQAEQLDGALGGALEALSQVPGRLEVEAPPHVTPIPSSAVRIDP